jgi:hypothetical protein
VLLQTEIERKSKREKKKNLGDMIGYDTWKIAKVISMSCMLQNTK